MKNSELNLDIISNLLLSNHDIFQNAENLVVIEKNEEITIDKVIETQNESLPEENIGIISHSFKTLNIYIMSDYIKL